MEHVRVISRGKAGAPLVEQGPFLDALEVVLAWVEVFVKNRKEGAA
jgi:hypothetical protein